MNHKIYIMQFMEDFFVNLNTRLYQRGILKVLIYRDVLCNSYIFITDIYLIPCIYIIFKRNTQIKSSIFVNFITQSVKFDIQSLIIWQNIQYAFSDMNVTTILNKSDDLVIFRVFYQIISYVIYQKTDDVVDKFLSQMIIYTGFI